MSRRTGALERGYACDADCAVAVERRAGESRKLCEGKAAEARSGGAIVAGASRDARRRGYLSASALITLSVMSMRWLA